MRLAGREIRYAVKANILIGSINITSSIARKIAGLVFLKKQLICISMLLSGVGMLSAQTPPPDLKFKKIGLEEGLSQVTARCILQDSTGYIWVGTQDGLNRFDGYNFKVFKHDPDDPSSLSSNFITDLLRDSHNRIWVATPAGLNLFDSERESFVNWKHDKTDPASLSDNFVSCLYEDSQSRLWIGTDNGLNLMDFSTGRFIHFPDQDISNSFTKNQITCISEDDKGNIWVGTTHGLKKFNLDQRTFTTYFHDPNEPNSINDNIINKLYKDHQGTLWIGTKRGLNSLDVASEVFNDHKSELDLEYSMTDDDITVIYEDHAEEMWIGTANGGLHVFDHTENRFYPYQNNTSDPYSLSNNAVWEFIEDRDRNLWVGVAAKGINYHNRNTQRFEHYRHIPGDPNSLLHNSVRATLLDNQDQLWIGTFLGINVYDKQRNGISRYQHDPRDPRTLGANYILALLQDKKNNVWVGNQSGLDLYNPESRDFTRVFDEEIPIERIFEDDRGYLWLSSFEGLFVFDPTTLKTRHFDNKESSTLSNLDVGPVLKDRKNRLWIGTFSGLNLYDQSTGSLTQYFHDPNDPASLSNDDIGNIVEDSQGRIWIGTRGGFHLFDEETGKFRRWREKDGLSNDYVYGMLSDDQDRLWLSTNKGINKFDPNDESFSIYDKRNGLQSNEFNNLAFYKDRNGKMYFGGVNGLSVFHPDSISDSDKILSVVLTDFLLFNKSITIGDSSKLYQSLDHTSELTLTYADDLFAFEFAALEYEQPEKVKYAYILEGYHNDWVYTDHSDRKAVFTRVPAGTYTFRVKATIDERNWTRQEKTLIVKVLPPWWQTWWAYTSYILISLAVVVIILRFQWRRIQLKQHLKLEQQEAEQFKKLDRLKTQFFSNITHEFRTPLTLIIAPAEQIMKQDSLDENYTRKQVGLIRRNSQKFLQLVNQLLDLSKLEGRKMTIELYKGDVTEFIQLMVENFQAVASQKQLRLSFESQLPVGNYLFDHSKLDKIVYNLLANAVKFTPDGGEIRVVLALAIDEGDRRKVILKIEDTGVGIPPESLPHIFDRFYQVDGSAKRHQEGTGIGLALTRELVELLGGTISVNSELGEGTRVVVVLPLGTANDEDSIQHVNEFKSESIFDPLILGEGQEVEEVEQVDEKSNQPSVLIIEDNNDLRAFIKSSIESTYQIITAKDGREGVTKALKYIPDLIISDIMMPAMDGYEVCDVIKQSHLTSHVPVILLTAKSSLKSRLEGYKTGADAYLTKPFNTEELQVVIEKLIASRQQLQEQFSNTQISAESSQPLFSELDQLFIDNLHTYIESELSNEDLGVEDVVKEAGMSHSQLYRKIKALTDLSIAGFVRNYRLTRALEMLKEGKNNVTEVANMTGFGNRRYFHKVFVEKYSYPPSEIRKTNITG